VLIKPNHLSETVRALLKAERVFAATNIAPPSMHQTTDSALVSLYTAWDNAEPGNGHDANAELWRAKLTKSPTAPAETWRHP
jgi:hypothetical protein